MYLGFHPDKFGYDYIFNGVSQNGEVLKIQGQWYLLDENGRILSVSSPQNDQIDQPSSMRNIHIIENTITKCEGKFFGS